MNDPTLGTAATADVEQPPDESARSIAGTTRANLVGAGCCFAVGTYAAVSGLLMGYWSDGPGAGFFPVWTGVLLGALALVWAVQTLREPIPTTEEAAAPDDRRRMLAMLAGVAVTVLLMEVIGYQLAMTGFALYALLGIFRRGWLQSVVIACAAGFGVFTLFAGLLQVYLPTASLPLLADLGL